MTPGPSLLPLPQDTRKYHQRDSRLEQSLLFQLRY